MISFVRRLATACLLALCSIAGPANLHALAKQERQPPATPFEGDAADLSPREIQRLFDAYVVMQAQERLALSDGQFPQFLTRLKSLQETRRRNQQRRNQLLLELARLSNPANTRADDSAVRERLKALQEHETLAAAELRKAYEALDQVLDVRQQARFRVFEEQIERRKVELLLRARHVNRPRQLNRQSQPPR